jgi:hypothetical protein
MAMVEVVAGELDYPGYKPGDKGSGLQILNSAVGTFRTARLQTRR